MPSKRLKLAARVDCGMSFSSAPQLRRTPLGGTVETTHHPI